MHHETVNSWHITEWHRKMTDRTKHTIRKKLHFTDECHQMMVLIRKRAHFTDDATLPFRDTGFLAKKGVSRKEKQLKVRKSARDTGSSAQKGVSLQGFASIFLNLFAIQSFWPEKVCHGRKSSSRCENLFAIQGLQLKRVYRCKGSPLFF